MLELRAAAAEAASASHALDSRDGLERLRVDHEVLQSTHGCPNIVLHAIDLVLQRGRM